MKIKTFGCGFCNKYIGTRGGLRLHLRENHIRNALFNIGTGNIKSRRREIQELE